MAPVPATITVNFIANYAGGHRICYRTGGSGPYTCISTSCAGGGTPCSGTIAVSVDNETCDPVVFDGYVQATCEDEESVNGRIPFTVTFTPNPECDAYSVACNDPGGCPDPISWVGTDCNGDAFPSIDGFNTGDTFYVCSGAAPTAVGYVVTQLAREVMCCYDCENVTFAASGGSARITYIDCATRALIDTTLGSGDDATVCVVTNSYYVGPNGTVSVLGTCP